MNLTLRDLDQKWRSSLHHADSPSLLGLAPLEAAECEVLTATVDRSLRTLIPTPVHRVDGFIRLLAIYPAAMAVWLSRLAGQAYEVNFWDNFAALLHCTEVPSDRRPQFANAFRRACRTVMANFVTPQVGTWTYVGEFLFQAGLPLCHCERFAVALRAIADAYGLPEPDDLDALRDVRDAMLGRTEIRQAPLVRQALEAASGLHLLGVVVCAVRQDAFGAINPELGRRLLESFATAGVGACSVALRWPWLRLEDDLTSFAIVGPPQPRSILGPSGAHWVVNGTSFRAGVEDEFVFPVTTEDRVKVELRGLAGGRSLQRDFAAHPGAEATPAFIFSAESQRRVRVALERECRLEAGDYWVVHPAEYTLDNAAENHVWFNSPPNMPTLATSRLTLRPGTVSILHDGWGEPICEFRPALHPFIELPGRRVSDETGECIHYGWTELPRVWVPKEEVDESWTLRAVTNGGKEIAYLLTRAGCTEEGSLVPLVPSDGHAVCLQLPPALHAVTFQALRNGRSRAERRVWLWHGLQAISSCGLECTALPENLVSGEMRGFVRDGANIRHLEDSLRRHSLVFSVGETRQMFAWRRPGISLESFEKVPGSPAEPRDHRLGETFSAAVDSQRWLRVWLVPARDAALRVNGREVFRFCPASERQFVDLSLAQLAAEHGEGGGCLTLRHGETQTLVARFVRPLQPVGVSYSQVEGHETLLCRFTDPVRHVRLHVSDLVSDRHISFPGQAFSASGHLRFEEPGFPAVELSHAEKTGACSSDLHRLQVQVPRAGWPPGFWRIELDIARDESFGWQPLLNKRGGRLPLLLSRALPVDELTSYRARCFAAVLAGPGTGAKIPFPPSTGHEAELMVLFGDVRRWLAPKFEDAAWKQLLPLEILLGELAKQVRWMVGNHPKTVLPALVEQLSEDSAGLGARSLFVRIPDLLALPPELAVNLPPTDPVRAALRWAADLASAARAGDGLRRVQIAPEFGLGEWSPDAPILRDFRNSKAVLGIGQRPDLDDDLSGFKFGPWFFWMARGNRGEPNVEVDALSTEHFSWALARLLQRRQAAQDAACWSAVMPVLAHNKLDFLASLRKSCPSIKHLFPTTVSGRVWFEFEHGDDFLAGECIQFSALLALGARIAARGWVSFWDVLKPLREAHGPGPVHKALTTLLTQAPELLGFHLMFWELMIRTYPHD
ncbi:MAG: hypothetical protein JO015_22305 [Verrucomicrobia bacterium]|nr:hypothetical protein [Verrucomicrobiota bacterium]